MNTVRLLKNGIEAFPAMFRSIDQAASCVALEMYIFADDRTGRELKERLISAALRGVHVMVLVDGWGARELPDSFWNELRTAGGLVRRFQPGLFPFRNHRKMLLVDQRIAFVGGMNIADEYYRGTSDWLPWRDNMLQISGPATTVLRRSFLRMWRRADKPLPRIFSRFRRDRLTKADPGRTVRFLESGPEDPLRPIRREYLQVIRKAGRSMDLAMGYFYPHGRILRALKRAVKRGVRVRLLFPKKTDVAIAQWAARGLYGRLLRSGLEVWEYKPAMMHAKLAVADDIVITGSANLDIRSGMINYELVVVVHDPNLAAAARTDFDEDLENADRILLKDWKKRPFLQRLKERLSYCLLARADILFARSGFARRMW